MSCEYFVDPPRTWSRHQGPIYSVITGTSDEITAKEQALQSARKSEILRHRQNENQLTKAQKHSRASQRTRSISTSSLTRVNSYHIYADTREVTSEPLSNPNSSGHYVIEMGGIYTSTPASCERCIPAGSAGVGGGGTLCYTPGSTKGLLPRIRRNMPEATERPIQADPNSSAVILIADDAS
jgi:hypothetical protein